VNIELLNQAATAVQTKWPDLAEVKGGVVLGSGWGPVADALEPFDSLPYSEIPGFGATGVEGHRGVLQLARIGSSTIMVFQGRRHWYEGAGWTPIAVPVFILKKLGASILMLTNAAGGIRPELKPGSLMAIEDHINLIGANPLTGPHSQVWGPQFPDQSSVYDPRLLDLLADAAQRHAIPLARGVYLASSGPSYETPAEIRAFQKLGADAVGMSTVPEAILANASGMRIAAISCITNYAAGVASTPLSHEEVTGTATKAMPTMQTLIRAFWEAVCREEK